MLRSRTATLALLLALPGSAALAHDDGPLADAHGPAGVMVDHMHKAGEFMIGYRYNWSGQSGGVYRGIDKVDEHALLHDACQNAAVAGHEHCMMKPKSMVMKMHMLDLMYAPTNWLTLMVMPQWMTMSMTMDMVEGAHMGHGMHAGPHSHGTDGIGDTTFGGLVKLSEGKGHKVHAGLMFSAPTASTSEKNASGQLTHYMMQLGSGTWDFLPSITYTARAHRWSWGVQVSGAVRMQDENDQGYRLGDSIQATAWGSYRFADAISGSLRLVHTHQDSIDGRLKFTGSGGSAPDIPANYGGNFTDLGVGLNTVVTSGALKGHRLGVEWLQPIRDNVNGYQQHRDGTLTVNWSKAF